MNPQKRQRSRIYQYQIDKPAVIGFQFSLPMSWPARRSADLLVLPDLPVMPDLFICGIASLRLLPSKFHWGR